MVTATHPSITCRRPSGSPHAPTQYEAVAALLAATARGVQRSLLVLPTGPARRLCLPSWCNAVAGAP